MTILQDVVNFLPTTTEDVLTNDAFKKNILLHITTALSTLNQNGVGKPVDILSDDTIDWDDFVTDTHVNGMVFAKQYVYLHVQLLFDTPPPSTATIMEKAMAESLWRCRLEFDNENTT